MNNNEYRAAYEIPFACFFLLFSNFCAVPVVQGGSHFCTFHARGSRFHDVEQSRQCFAGVGTDTGFPRVAGEERALYALLLTQARYKSCVLLENDSLIQIAVDYYEGGGKQERLAQAYFYWGMCLYGKIKEFSEGDKPLSEVAGTDAKEKTLYSWRCCTAIGELL